MGVGVAAPEGNGEADTGRICASFTLQCICFDIATTLPILSITDKVQGVIAEVIRVRLVLD